MVEREATKHEGTESGERAPRWEVRFGCSLAVLAAALAVNDLGGGKFGSDELAFSNEKTSTYMWYQSKGLKESLAEGQRDFLGALLAGSGLEPSLRGDLQTRREQVLKDVERYGREKREILLGSKAVGESGWAQDMDGELGKVIGAQDYERAIEGLGAAGDRFDLANLFLQLSLVAGAIGILLSEDTLKRFFFFGMLSLGAAGLVFSALAYRLALSVSL